MAEEQPEKPKITRGIMATLPAHAQDEMREANRELGMALEVVSGIVDAAVAEALPPGRVTELVVKKRREDDEAALARRRVMPGGFTLEQARAMRPIPELADEGDL